ncbi:MAG: hypothetical protein R6X23_04005, partial [Acidimicrobiia bacterium]
MATETGKRIRDDVRDSWHSPGNRRQLSRLIDILCTLHQARPDIEIINLSGDIHTSNAFTAQPKGFAKPIYQVTSSALTNRPHLPPGTISRVEVVAGVLPRAGNQERFDHGEVIAEDMPPVGQCILPVPQVRQRHP